MESNKQNPSLEADMKSLVEVLSASVRRHPADGLLLSGGLDTSVLAALASQRRKPYCLTVALKGAPAPDIEYAKKIAETFNLRHEIIYFGEQELENSLRATIQILGSFDPMEVRNSTACYIGLKAAKDRGLASVMTGDGGDELLAGYSFFFDLKREQLSAELSKMWANMSFSSIPLGHDLGIAVALPFLDTEFIAFAKRLDPALLVNIRNGKPYGKWILRKAFESTLSPEVVWRVKAPLEVGTGTTTLPSYYDSGIANSEFAEKKARFLAEDRVKLRSKEHLHYYEIYRSTRGIPHLKSVSGRSCPECGSNVKENFSYCRVCGAYPI